MEFGPYVRDASDRLKSLLHILSAFKRTKANETEAEK